MNLAVESLDGRQLHGFVFSYGADFKNAHAWVGVLANQYEGAGAVALSGMLLLFDHLFGSFPFDRLYAEMSESAATQYGSALREPFVREAHFVDFFRHGGGETEDKFVYTLRRDAYLAWRSAAGRLL